MADEVGKFLNDIDKTSEILELVEEIYIQKFIQTLKLQPELSNRSEAFENEMTRNLPIFHFKSFHYPILLSNCLNLTLYILFAVDDMETSSRRN